MTNEFDALEIDHPAPDRGKLPVWSLMLPLFAPILVWGAHLVINVLLVMGRCFNDYGPPAPRVGPGDAAWTALLINNLGALVIILATGLIALRNWRSTSGEENQPHGLLLDIGEGRTNFLAHWGVIVSFGFLLVTIFDSIVIFLVPLCGG